MLVVTRSLKNPSVKRLIKLWERRYIPNLSSLESWSEEELREAASPHGRALTSAKLRDSLIELTCQMAGMQTNIIYAYIPNVVDLNEARRLTHYAFLIYKKIMEIYQQHSLVSSLPIAIRKAATVNSENASLLSWGMPTIEELATLLEPVLLEFQEQHVASKDWRTLGFITTLLNFSSNLMFRKLTAVEKVLLKPYFQFIEEQVALPWQRVCVAAAKHQLGSPTLTLVEQMIPKSYEIAQTVYRQLAQLNPHHRSRRGALTDPGIAHSTIRDLEMFQCYLWLCVLEESLEPVEMELIDLSVMVMTGVDVKWELTEQFIQLLIDEIINRVTSDQMELLLPYIQRMQQAFFEERLRFAAIPRASQSDPDLHKAYTVSFPKTGERSIHSHQDNNISAAVKHNDPNPEIEKLEQKLHELKQELADTRDQLAMHLKNPGLYKRALGDETRP